MMQNDMPRLPDPDYQKALQNAMNNTFINYRGCIILKADEGYKWGDQWHSTLLEAHNSIDQAMKALSENMGTKLWEMSIVHKDGTETILSDEYKQQYLTGKSPYMRYKNVES